VTTTAEVLGHTSAANVITSAVHAQYQRNAVLSPLLCLGGLLVMAGVSALRGDLGGLLRHVTLFLPLGVVLVVVAPRLFTTVLTVSDSLTTSIGGAMLLPTASSPWSFHGVTGLDQALVGLLCALSAVLLWIELIVRNVLLAVLLCCVPFVAALLVWSPMRRVVTRLAEAIVVIGLTKPFIAMVLSLGLSAMSVNGGTVAGITGVATLLLAVLAPFVLLRVVPVFETSALHAVDGLRQRVSRSVAAAPQHPVAQGVAIAMAPKVAVPAEPGDDLGIEMWEGSGESPLPPLDAAPPPLPLRPVRLPGRHFLTHDHLGPVISFEFDDE
jgi:hypothetical protein